MSDTTQIHAGCPFHTDMVGTLREHSTRLEEVKERLDRHTQQIDNLSKTASNAVAVAEDAIPDIRKRLEAVFESFEAISETNKLYCSQVREMSQTVEMLQDMVRRKADRETLNAATRSTFVWVKAGFVAIAVSLMLWAMSMVSREFLYGALFKRVQGQTVTQK